MDKAGFKHIFDEYFDSIRRYIYYRTGDTDVSSDIAQDLFMRLWEKRDRLSDSNLRALLYKMASDSVISRYRKETVKGNYLKSMRASDYADSSYSPQQLAELEETKRRYAQTLIQMTEMQRTAFLMNREESLKYDEIASRLDVSIKTVEKRISGALKMLRKSLL